MEAFQITSVRAAISMLLAAQRVLSGDNRSDFWKNMKPLDIILSSETSHNF